MKTSQICDESHASLAKSKRIELVRRKLIRMLPENRRVVKERNFPLPLRSILFRAARNEPLAPYPIKAILTTKNAKW